VSVSTRVVDRGWNAIMRELATANRTVVDVGILGAGHANDPHKGENEDGEHPLLIDVATWNEYGAGNIPERSFLRETVDLNEQAIGDRLLGELRKVATGKQTAADAFERTGIDIVARIQKRIAAGIAPANSERTIERKGSSKPLVDTGQLRSGITYLVRTK
jgi:hypothetical protein